MRGFLIRTLICALGLWLAAKLLPQMHFASEWTLVGAAVLLGVVNAVVRPILVVLTLPITVVTLGLFLLVVNAGMLGLVAWLLDGFTIGSFGTALVGSIVVSLTGWVGSWFIGPRGRVEVMTVRYEAVEEPRVEKVVRDLRDG
ncbi:MAG: phage holin family protein [Myxococcota bacterium]